MPHLIPRHQRQKQQLGMSTASARNRLMRGLIFKLLQETGGNICHVCQQPITSLDDMTFEHIEPWENRDASLYFDLTNVAFSHPKCNRVHKPAGGAHRRKVSPEGYGNCSMCQKTLLLKHFHKHSTRWDGRKAECKACEHLGKGRPKNKTYLKLIKEQEEVGAG